jgi:hypothetical protein
MAWAIRRVAIRYFTIVIKLLTNKNKCEAGLKSWGNELLVSGRIEEECSYLFNFCIGFSLIAWIFMNLKITHSKIHARPTVQPFTQWQ